MKSTAHLGGTQFRLSDDGTSVTTKGGRLQKEYHLATLEAGNRTFVLSSEQSVATPDGPKKVKDLKEGRDVVAFARTNPLHFGTAEFPNTAYLLGVMSCSYDDNYQMVVSTFTQEQRTSIQQALPLAVKELQLEQKGPLYPKFVRVNVDDERQRWVLTSGIFRQLLDVSLSNGIYREGVLVAEAVSKATFISWVRGLSYSPQSLPPLVMHQWADALHRMNIWGSPFPELVQHLEQVEQSDHPLLLRGKDWKQVTRLTISSSDMSTLFHFDEDSWVYPNYSDIKSGGLLCLNGKGLH